PEGGASAAATGKQAGHRDAEPQSVRWPTRGGESPGIEMLDSRAILRSGAVFVPREIPTTAAVAHYVSIELVSGAVGDGVAAPGRGCPGLGPGRGHSLREHIHEVHRSNALLAALVCPDDQRSSEPIRHHLRMMFEHRGRH